MRKIEVVPHSSKWHEEFLKESKLILEAFKNQEKPSEENLIVAIHHIGSTAIPGIYAKPIIDILIEVTNIYQVDRYNSQMIALGYETKGEFGIPGRRYFPKEVNQIRTHHVHVFAVNSEHIIRHIKFRDYMIAHPQHGQTYSQLKQDLAKKFPHDIEAYMDGKDGFIKKMEAMALAWEGN